MQLAHQCENGGLINHRLTASVIEEMALDGFESLIPSISPAESRFVTAQLQAYESRHEPLEDVLARDDIFNKLAYGPFGRLFDVLREISGEKRIQDESFQDVDKRNVGHFRLLICDLAIHLYREEQGRLPAQLADLTPKHLTAVLVDPFSGEPIRYKIEAGGYVIYSVGPNGQDDNGRKDRDNGDWPVLRRLKDGSLVKEGRF